MDASEYEAIIERCLRDEFGLLGPEDSPPRGPVACATEVTHEDERLLMQLVTEREAPWEPMVRFLLSLPSDKNATPLEAVWRDPAAQEG